MTNSQTQCTNPHHSNLINNSNNSHSKTTNQRDSNRSNKGNQNRGNADTSDVLAAVIYSYHSQTLVMTPQKKTLTIL